MSATRLAIVGFGAVAEKHVEVFRALGAEVVASCNRSEAGRQKARDKAGIPNTYAEPLEMADKERPDGLIVTANVLSQYGLVRDLILSGIPLLVEKPAGTSLAEADELANLADAHGTPVMVALNRRFYSVYHQALERMGGRPAVTAVTVEWSEDPAKMLAVGHPAALLPVLNFANSLHGIDLLPFFAGDVQSPLIWGRNLDPSAKQYRWQMALDGVSSSAARVHFDSNWDVPGRWRLVVDAPDARLVSAPLETGLLLVRGKPAEQLTPSPEDAQFKPGFYGQAQAFLSLVRERAPLAWPACSLQDALPTMRLTQQLTDACLSITSSLSPN
jgi:predicted dehydrogenase